MSLLTESMPNYNRKNPFVIICKDLRDDVDTHALSMTKQMSVTYIGFAITALLLIVGLVYVSIHERRFSIRAGIAMSYVIHVFVYICIATGGIRGTITDGLMDKVDKILAAEISEVMMMNNEELLNAILEMTRRVGQLETYQSIYRAFFYTNIIHFLMLFSIIVISII